MSKSDEQPTIQLTVDEALAVIEELSFRPYRDGFKIIAILSARVHEANENSKPQIITE